jgi:hypothetical protein
VIAMIVLVLALMLVFGAVVVAVKSSHLTRLPGRER